MLFLRSALAVTLAVLLPLAAVAQSDDDVTKLAKTLLLQAQTGHFDRTQFSGALDALMDDDAVAGLVTQLKPLGAPVSFDMESKTAVDTTTAYVFRVAFKSAVIEESLTLGSDGKIVDLSFKTPQ